MSRDHRWSHAHQDRPGAARLRVEVGEARPIGLRATGTASGGRLVRALGEVALVATLVIVAEAAGSPRLAVAGVECAASVQHPIEVRVRVLDPVRRGATVRLEVRATARAPITDAEVRLISPGGTRVAGLSRLSLGRLGPERDAAGTFRVTVPDLGRRFLVQFVVRGEGPVGPLSRGAVYNLLPDGPLDPGRPVTASDGARILEFAAERSGR